MTHNFTNKWDDNAVKPHLYQWCCSERHHGTQCRKSSLLMTYCRIQRINIGDDLVTFCHFGHRGAAQGTVMITGKVEIHVQKISPHFTIDIQSDLMFCSPVLLTDKQIECVLRPQEIVIIQDFHCTHPVRIEVTCNLTQKRKKHEMCLIKL